MHFILSVSCSRKWGKISYLFIVLYTLCWGRAFVTSIIPLLGVYVLCHSTAIEVQHIFYLATYLSMRDNAYILNAFNHFDYIFRYTLLFRFQCSHQASNWYFVLCLFFPDNDNDDDNNDDFFIAGFQNHMGWYKNTDPLNWIYRKTRVDKEIKTYRITEDMCKKKRKM